MKIVFALIYVLSISICHSQIGTKQSATELEKLINKKDTNSLKKYIRKFDSDFQKNWKLKEIETNVEIDHFEFGYNIEWHKRKSDTIIYRTYTFDDNGQFYYGFEQRKLKNELISRGGIYLKNGRLDYISQYYPKRSEIILAVGKYEFELYDKGKLVAIYRTRNLNHYYMLKEEKNKDGIELVYGIDYLNVKK